MSKTQANKLKIGDVVHWRGKIPGKVVFVTPGACINVQWEDGERSATHPADCEGWTREPAETVCP